MTYFTLYVILLLHLDSSKLIISPFLAATKYSIMCTYVWAEFGAWEYVEISQTLCFQITKETGFNLVASIPLPMPILPGAIGALLGCRCLGWNTSFRAGTLLVTCEIFEGSSWNKDCRDISKFVRTSEAYVGL